MPVYEYTALDIKGKTISGIIDADSSRSALQKLRASKTYPVSIEEVHDTAAIKAPKTFSVLRPFTRVKPQEVSMMTRQLATLLGAGLPLVPAIAALTSQTRSQSFKKMLAKIKDSIVEGNSFARSLSLFPGTFSALYINMVTAGETSGALEIVLERLADITEKQQALKNRIRSAMAYPILMSLIGVLVLFLLLTFIVPNITSIFTDMNQTLPAPTLFLIRISDIFKIYWWIILIGIAAAVLILRRINKTVKGGYVFDKIKLQLPRLGLLTKKLAVARFSRTLGSLLENGVSMLPALGIVKNIVGNALIADAIEDASKEVSKGKGLGSALAESKIFPDLSIQMIQVGEQSGKLEEMLNKVADVFESEVEGSIMTMTSLLEPVMILMMAVIVGFIVLSICLPIFEMSQLVR
ncbi:MAG: type II secretion system inner membrane protein GspF [Desulfobacterales bacterium]|jgi:general secretion pathway protein F|nr:type II secretion system inner membrane protein GspF [Deltaproteobacteria bacterium]MBW1747633.1 type II secretion system inner membrane protein GspF [Deltaproteobacteria bacterium]MBW2196858.1 type II secretion system inner membrane protein GspF [Deltaproteobacteria bacterium]MBW2226210.1 type II secretion system inner membrane protein GspF [Deltaproteobacteria bacterium]MDX2498387.1 type II secretion system inner membrane protein GspF [Desulfobacterales bacterium]